MINRKILAPSNDLFNQDYKLSYFCESLSKHEENQIKSENNDVKRFKKLKKWYKKDILHIEMFKPVCPKCFTKNVVKNEFKERILYFYDKGEVKVELQSYRCKKCGKKFKTDISKIVEDNGNFTHEFKRKSLELVALFFGSVRSVAYRVKEDTGVSVSRQTIENWVLKYKNQNRELNSRYSGYYIFDVEWVKIQGQWNYRFTLFDSKQNTVVADDIYSKENSKNVREFLEKNTRNKNKIAITTDLDEKYKPVIENLGFKHQWCLFHAFKNFNKVVKKFIKENDLSEEEIDKIRKEKLELFSLFDSKSYKPAKNKFNKLLSKIKEFSEVIQSIILDSLMPYFKTFFNFLDDKNIESTSNKIENFFKRTLPKSVKKIMKTKNGVTSRITLRTEMWDRANFIKI
jgi:transposase-like protein